MQTVKTIEPEVIDEAPLPVKLADMTIERLRETAESYRALKVTGEGKDRKKSFDVVRRAHIDGNKVVSRIKKRTTDLRRPILAEAKEISDVAKIALEIIEPVVEDLSIERRVEESRIRKIVERKVDAERHRIAVIKNEIDSRKTEWASVVVRAESLGKISEIITEIGAYEIDPFFFEEFTDEMCMVAEAASIAADTALDAMTVREQAEAAKKAESDRIAAEQAAEAKRLEDERKAFEAQQAEAEAARKAAEAEAERKQSIQDLFNRYYQRHADLCKGVTVPEWNTYITGLQEQVYNLDAFEEQADEAREYITSITVDAIERRDTLLKQEVETEALRKRQEEMDAREAVITEQERQAAEKKAREEAEAQAKIESEAQAKLDAEQRIKNHYEAMEINQQIDDERKRRAEEDRLKTEVAAKVKVEAEEKERARQEALKPDKEKVESYFERLLLIDPPEVSGEVDDVLELFKAGIAGLTRKSMKELDEL